MSNTLFTVSLQELHDFMSYSDNKIHYINLHYINS